MTHCSEMPSPDYSTKVQIACRTSQQAEIEQKACTFPLLRLIWAVQAIACEFTLSFLTDEYLSTLVNIDAAIGRSHSLAFPQRGGNGCAKEGVEG